MKSTIIAFVTLFSCTYIWHPVAAQSEDCNFGSCYNGLEDTVLYTFQFNGDRFCNVVASTAEMCVDGLNLTTQGCINHREWAKAEFPYLCSLPRGDVGASLQCFIALTIMGNGTLCDDATAPFGNTTGPFDVCAYYAAILGCYKEEMTSRCPDHVGPALHYLTTQFDYQSRGLRPNDCPVFQELDTGGAGTLASPSTFYWIETAMIALYISAWLYA